MVTTGHPHPGCAFRRPAGDAFGRSVYRATESRSLAVLPVVPTTDVAGEQRPRRPVDQAGRGRNGFRQPDPPTVWNIAASALWLAASFHMLARRLFNREHRLRSGRCG